MVIDKIFFLTVLQIADIHRKNTGLWEIEDEERRGLHHLCVLPLTSASVHWKGVSVGAEFLSCTDPVNWSKVSIIIETVIWCMALFLT